LVALICFDAPVCPVLVDTLEKACAGLGVSCHKGGTYICIEGPAFSTKAESNLYRAWGMDLIGMTSLQEAKLAREAEICYAVLAMVTDYDCWHADHEAVTVNQVLEYLSRNVENSRRILLQAVRAVPTARGCACASAMAHAVLTDPKKIPTKTKKKFALLVGKYIK
jgi:5'-methylthioadenosine phosphorylase